MIIGRMHQIDSIFSTSGKQGGIVLESTNPRNSGKPLPQFIGRAAIKELPEIKIVSRDPNRFGRDPQRILNDKFVEWHA